MLLHKKQRARFPIIKRYVVYTKTAANLIKLQWFPSGVLQGHLAMLDVTLISSTEARRTSCGKLLPAPAVTYQTFQLGHTKEASPVHSRPQTGTSEGLRKQVWGGKLHTRVGSSHWAPVSSTVHLRPEFLPPHPLQHRLARWGQFPGHLLWEEGRDGPQTYPHHPLHTFLHKPSSDFSHSLNITGTIFIFAFSGRINQSSQMLWKAKSHWLFSNVWFSNENQDKYLKVNCLLPLVG